MQLDIKKYSSNIFKMFNPNYNQYNFNEISNKILNQTVLVAANKKFRICEIEMYLNSESHPDTYTHSHKDQQSFGKFYFHKYSNNVYKSGTWKGLDIVLGDKSKYFGILIRSMVELDADNKEILNEFIEGPCRCVNKILEQFDSNNVSELFAKQFPNQTQIDFETNPQFKLEFSNNLGFEEIYEGPRIGLSDKYPEYMNKNYRYAIFTKKIKKNSKTFVKSQQIL